MQISSWVIIKGHICILVKIVYLYNLTLWELSQFQTVFGSGLDCILQQWSPTLFAPRTGLISDNLFTDRPLRAAYHVTETSILTCVKSES